MPGSDLTFTYDADGLRLSKSMAGGLTTTYQYVNGQLLGEEHSDGTALRFTYDPFGALSGIQYKSANGSTTDYYVRCTLNGDVDQIYDTSGNLLARYIYDSWGRTVSILNGSGQEILTGDHIAVVNPIRYRGYYYDGESGLYYLQSRYYDAKTGRYVNPDGYVYTGQDMQSGNMYAYCGNNPIINIDPTGSMYVRGARDVVGGDTQEFTPVPKDITKANRSDLSTPSRNSWDVGVVVGKVGESLFAIFSSITVDLGAGIGGMADTNALVLEGSIGAKWDFFSIHYSYDEGLNFGQYFESSANLSLKGILNAGVAAYQYFPSCSIAGSVEKEMQFALPSILGVSVGAYAGFGASASVGWDLDRIIAELERIWLE